MLRQWLEARRASFENPESLPGSLAWGTWRILLKSLAVLGFFAGAGLAANLLQYDGFQPVNVATYLGWLVIVQIGLVLLAGLVVGVILVKVVNLQSFGWSLQLELPGTDLLQMAAWVIAGCLVAGIAPAVLASRLEPATILREDG